MTNNSNDEYIYYDQYKWWHVDEGEQLIGPFETKEKAKYNFDRYTVYLYSSSDKVYICA
jgi:hypothetical protein